MNRFVKVSPFEKLKSSSLLPILLFASLLLFFLYGVTNVSQSDVMDEKRILNEALQRDISHCYAIEGTYPPSLKYMQEHYGLTYDSERFLVNYEYIGSNVLPTYQIIVK